MSKQKSCPVCLVTAFVFGVFLTVGWNRECLGQVPTQLAKHQTHADLNKTDPIGSHGGTLREVDDLRIETLLSESGIEVFCTDLSGRSLEVNAARGLAMIQEATQARRYRYDLLPEQDGRLKASNNLSRLRGKQVQLEILLVGVRSALGESKSIRLKDTISLEPTPEQLAAGAIARQAVCPVSGKRLGSMGPPVAVSVGESTFYVCCDSCRDTVALNPLVYQSGKPKIQISTATKEDAEAIAWQKVCPVMDEPLGGMGQPIKVMVGERPIYLCCRGCIKKIEAEPQKYLDMVYGSPESSDIPAASSIVMSPRKSVALAGKAVRTGVFPVTEEDRPFIAAQKRCPVMDEPLDAMGGPYKVNANGKAIYICCPGCAKRIAAEPESYLGILKDQGVEAPIIR